MAEDIKAKMGYWIKHEKPLWGKKREESYECSNCGLRMVTEYINAKSNAICPSCRARMEGVKE